MRLSAEFDSVDGSVVAKASRAVLNGVAKLKATCNASLSGDINGALFSVVFPNTASINFDVFGRNAVLMGNVDITDTLALSLNHDVQAQQSCMVAQASFPKLSCAAQLILNSPPGNPLPLALGKAGVSWPNGGLQYTPATEGPATESEHEEEAAAADVSGSMTVPVDGWGEAAMLSASFSTAARALQCTFKRKTSQLTLMPVLSLLPSPSIQLAFKRRFDKVHKLSLFYNAADVSFAAIYKCQPEQHLKAKLGYDSKAGLYWSSIWFGNESEGASSAPHKTKVQLMLQVPETEGLKGASLMLRAKKRMDLFL